MALEIRNEILGQEATPSVTYCYLYEPLRINIFEDDLTAVKLYVDVEMLDLETQVVIETFPKYGEFDINPNVSLTFDAMDLVQQLHESNIFKFANVQSILDSAKFSIVSKFIYKFSIYSDKTTSPIVVRKLPIIGGREFMDFEALVTKDTPITEFQKYNINEEELAERWQGYTFLKASLKDVSDSNLVPTITKIEFPQETVCDGGILIWRSSLGGWMFWGFTLNKKTPSHKYNGNIEVGKFKSDKRVNGSPYVEIDYTGVETTYTIELKSLSLSKDELQAVSGINSATAIYYTNRKDGRLELMRLTAASTPISNTADGGDFTVSLENISTNTQKTQ